ncbi:MAG: BNR-4 repeat-containing protein [Candidatus Hydrogenedentota bacterium]
MFLFTALTFLIAAAADTPDGLLCEKDTGYRGIWYFNQRTDDEYVYKYSGGLGTYCAKHIPVAVYAPEVDKTFFVFGGTRPDERALIHLVSYYDHETGRVPQPTLLLDKKTSDAHDNPVLAVDAEGYLWVFSSSHGTSRPSYVSRSVAPYDIEAFELIHTTNFSYPQPWAMDGAFFFMHTYYEGGRSLRWWTSGDGADWSERHLLAHIDAGHYQVSWPHANRVGTAFNYHPEGKGLNWRTNLYYVETDDMGASWRNVQGAVIDTPITTVDNPGLVHDYEAEQRNVYMKDVNYDAEGRPLILHVTSSSWKPGPEYGPRKWRIAHWTGEEWRFSDVTGSDNNYDTGCVHVAPDGKWHVIGPTETGPQPFNPGGEIAHWVSSDTGATWEKARQLTGGSEFNHTYARRPVNADPGFYAFWADGHGRQPSESRLYFYSLEDDTVYRLPYEMEGESAAPEPVFESLKSE